MLRDDAAQPFDPPAQVIVVLSYPDVRAAVGWLRTTFGVPYP